MSAYLKFSADTRQERVPCASVTTIGRDRSNTIVLPDLQVSRNHALVRRLGAADYYFIDSGSANGSQVNARRITSPALLRDGDRITIGTTELLFIQESQQPSLKESVSLQETVVVHTPLIKEITILVADIRGFTTMSEQLPIQTLTRLMNAWFEQVSGIIERHGGTVDKFIGDCVFARWESGAPRNNVIDALSTACRISTITSKLGITFTELTTPLRIGAGINTGLASLGTGSENTALGDAVNTAFRLESATKELGVDIVLSESSFASLPEPFWHGRAQQVKLKGKQTSVTVAGLDFAQAENLLTKIAD